MVALTLLIIAFKGLAICMSFFLSEIISIILALITFFTVTSFNYYGIFSSFDSCIVDVAKNPRLNVSFFYFLTYRR